MFATQQKVWAFIFIPRD